MDIEISKHNDINLLKLTGRLAIDASENLLPEFEKIITSEADLKTKVAGFDCSGLTYIDSTGIGVFVKCMKGAISNDFTLYLLDVPEQISRIFKTAGLNKFFKMIDSDEFKEKYINEDDIDQVIDSL